MQHYSNNEGSIKRYVVELMGRYSKQGWQLEKIKKILAEMPSGKPRQAQSASPKPRQNQRRLDAREVEALIADYRTGVPVKAIAKKFGINARTVSDHARRKGVPFRNDHRVVTPEKLASAIEMYKSGKAVAAIARHLGVGRETLRTALIASGLRARE